MTYDAGVCHIAVCSCTFTECCILQKGVRGEGEGEGWLVGLVGVGSTLKEHDQRRVTGAMEKLVVVLWCVWSWLVIVVGGVVCVCVCVCV